MRIFRTCIAYAIRYRNIQGIPCFVYHMYSCINAPKKPGLFANMISKMNYSGLYVSSQTHNECAFDKPHEYGYGLVFHCVNITSNPYTHTSIDTTTPSTSFPYAYNIPSNIHQLTKCLRLQIFFSSLLNYKIFVFFSSFAVFVVGLFFIIFVVVVWSCFMLTYVVVLAGVFILQDRIKRTEW